MTKIVKKIGEHTIEADHNAWGTKKIILDGKEVLSAGPGGNETEIVDIDEKKIKVRFFLNWGFPLFPYGDVEIIEV